MADNIERVTLENAADQLKQKIRMAFVELLPEEQWKEMVAAELKRFTEATSEYNHYQSKHIPVPSAFSKICSEVFTEYLKTEIKTVLMSPDWSSGWGNNGREKISGAIKAWCTEHSQALIESTVQALAAGAAQQLVSTMRHMP